MCLQKESEFKNAYVLTKVDSEGQSYILQAWNNDPRLKTKYDIIDMSGKVVKTIYLEKGEI